MGRKLSTTDAAAALNMLPKLLDVPISTYLMVFAKIRRPSMTPFGQDAQILVQQHDVGGVLGDVGGAVHGDADVRMVQGQGVVDAVAHETRPPRRFAAAAG